MHRCGMGRTLRCRPPAACAARVEDGRVSLDLRTIEPGGSVRVAGAVVASLA